MDALYDFLPVPSANAEDTTPRLYPKIVSRGTVTFEKLTEQIANHSGLTKGTILAVMDEIEYWTAQYLSDGYRVQIGNIGTASVSLKANTEVYDPSDVHAQSIRFAKVRLTASKKFTKQCQGNVLRAPARKENLTESQGAFGRRKAAAPPVVSGKPRLYHPESIRRTGRTAQDHRLARPEQVDGSTPYRHRRTRAAPGLCEASVRP